jgi:hypothetical protein
MFCFFVYFFTSFCFWILLIYCPEIQFANNTSDCASQCNCRNQYQPVCIYNYTSLYNTTKNNVYSYQSPCHAGCYEQLSKNEFTNCVCLNKFDLLPGISVNKLNSLNLSNKYCNKNLTCLNSLILNCVAAFLIVFITAMALIPQLKALMGSVNDIKLLPFALGIRAALVRIVGNFAGSLIFGHLLDLTCKIWQVNSFNQKACQLYNNQSMSTSLAVIGFICRFTTAVFMLLASLLFIKEDRKNKDTKAS